MDSFFWTDSSHSGYPLVDRFAAVSGSLGRHLVFATIKPGSVAQSCRQVRKCPFGGRAFWWLAPNFFSPWTDLN